MIPPVDLPVGVTLPREVREGAVGAQQEYRTALAFERILLGQLTKAMQSSIGGGEEAASAATEAYKNMLPDTMADALLAGGGIGLASDLVRELRTDRP